MAEPAQAVIDVPAVPPIVVEPEPVVVPEPKVEDVEVDLTQEPGGDKPEDVYARRRARELRQTKQELDNERQQRIRLEERTRILEEQAKAAPKTTEKIFTIAEVNAAVENGTLPRADADRYIDEVILPARIEGVISKREKLVADKAPVESAGKYVDDYIDLMPTLKDKTSDDFTKVGKKYAELVGQGLPADFRTQKVALDLVHGELSARQKRAEIANLNARSPKNPVDGGGGGPIINGKIDLGKAPSHLVAYWEKTGTSAKDRETEMAYWQKNQQKRK